MRECVSHIGKSIPRERDILMMSEMEGETESWCVVVKEIGNWGNVEKGLRKRERRDGGRVDAWLWKEEEEQKDWYTERERF